MKDRTNWENQLQNELHQADIARAAGNEGMARVSARRAAGIIIGEFFRRHGGIQPGPSAYDRLKFLRQQPEISQKVRQVAEHFLVRITPEYELPVEADLIAEARWLQSELLDR
jgi:hypothetical protein